MVGSQDNTQIINGRINADSYTLNSSGPITQTSVGAQTLTASTNIVLNATAGDLTVNTASVTGTVSGAFDISAGGVMTLVGSTINAASDEVNLYGDSGILLQVGSGNMLRLYRTVAGAGTDIFQLYSDNASTERLVAYVEANGAMYAQSFNLTCDGALKRDIVPHTDTFLDKLCDVPLRRFKNFGNTVEYVGLVAQELEKVIPLAVNDTIDREHKTINLLSLLSYTIGAIQDLNQLYKELSAPPPAKKRKSIAKS